MSTATLSPRDAIRLQRAHLKRQLGTGELSLQDALEAPAFQTMLLFDLLIHLPAGTGPRRLRHGSKDGRRTEYGDRLFCEIQRGPLTRVQDISARERDVLVRAHRRREYKR